MLSNAISNSHQTRNDRILTNDTAQCKLYLNTKGATHLYLNLKSKVFEFVFKNLQLGLGVFELETLRWQ